MAAPKNPASARLTRLRGDAAERAPNVRALAKFAANSTCKLATLGFAARVDFDTILENTRYAVPYGQSPFAFRRGNTFEERLRADRHQPIRTLLRDSLQLVVDPVRVKNVREDKRGNRAPIAKRADTTQDLLASIVRGERDAPQLIDGAVLSREIGGQRAFFEADAVAVQVNGRIQAGEIKSFPTVDGQADPDKVGAAIQQVAIYVLLLRDLVTQVGGDPESVSSDALLITPKNTGLQPVMAIKPIGREVDRARRILDAAPTAAELVADLPASLPSFGNVATSASEAERIDAAHALADQVGTNYVPSCLSSCGMSRLCRERAHDAGDPSRLGGHLVRMLPDVNSLERVSALASGKPPTALEQPVAEQLVRVERLRRRFASGSV